MFESGVVLLFSVFAFLLILGLFLRAYTKKSAGKINAFVVISFVVLFVVHAFVEADSLHDLPAYKSAFLECISLPYIHIKDAYWAASMEEGFLCYMKTLSFISSDFTIVLIVNTLILLACYYRVILKYSPYVYVSILLLFVTIFGQSLFVLRQHLCMAILTLSWVHIFKKEYVKFGLFLLVAFMLHRTALIYAPLFLLYNIRSNRAFITSIIVTCIIFASSYMLILRYLVSEVGSLQGYAGYINNVKYEGANYVSFILMLSLFLTMIYFMRSAIFEHGINRLLFSIICIAVIGSFFGVGNSSTGRLFSYYTYIPYLLVPVVMKYIRNKIVQVGYAAFYLSLYVYISYFGSTSIYYEDLKLLFLD